MRLHIPALLLLMFTAPVLPVSAENGAARTVKYSDKEIIPIRAKVRFSTLIVLPADEDILDFTTGDKDFWIINGIHNLCYLHPAQPGIRSNLNLVTASGHVYSFLLTEVSKDGDADPDLKVFVTRDAERATNAHGSSPQLVRASDVDAYKAEIAELRAELGAQARQSEENVEKQTSQFRVGYSAKLNFDYVISKKAKQAPFLVSAIYRDDRFTYVKSTAREKPAIYETKDGKPNLVNFDFANGVYVIPKILDSGYLAVGKKHASFQRHQTQTN